MKLRVKPPGFVLITVLGLIIGILGVATGIFFFAQVQRNQILRKVDAQEGFYAAEAAAWFNYHKYQINPNYGGTPGERTVLSLTQTYVNLVPPPSTTTSPGGQGSGGDSPHSSSGESPSSDTRHVYVPGTPLAGAATQPHDQTQTTIRRYAEGDLKYNVPPAAGAVDLCGYMKEPLNPQRTCLFQATSALPGGPGVGPVGGGGGGGGPSGGGSGPSSPPSGGGSPTPLTPSAPPTPIPPTTPGGPPTFPPPPMIEGPVFEPPANSLMGCSLPGHSSYTCDGCVCTQTLCIRTDRPGNPFDPGPMIAVYPPRCICGSRTTNYCLTYCYVNWFTGASNCYTPPPPNPSPPAGPPMGPYLNYCQAFPWDPTCSYCLLHPTALGCAPVKRACCWGHDKHDFHCECTEEYPADCEANPALPEIPGLPPPAGFPDDVTCKQLQDNRIWCNDNGIDGGAAKGSKCIWEHT